MMLELFLVNLFRENGLNLYRTIPTNKSMPYILYDRLSGDSNVYHKYSRGSFSFDIYCKNMEQINDQFSKVKEIFSSLEKSDDRFIQANVYNFVDNSLDNEKIVYTVNVEFLHIEDL